MKKLMMAGVALALIAGSANAAVTLQTTPSSTSTPVTTSVDPACTIVGASGPISVTVPINGGAITAPPAAASTIQVVCNTPKGVVAIGSDPLKNTAVIDPSETALFTNTIDFAGYARRQATGDGSWRLASRTGNSKTAWQSAYLDANVPNTRTQTLEIFAIDFETLTKLPVAGTYTGQICVSVNPSGTPLSAQGNGFCTTP